MKTLLLLPARHLTSILPILMVLGFAVGLVADTSELKRYILPVTVFMIFPNMIGFRVGDMFNLSHGRLVLASLAINFTLIPLVAYFLGTTFLLRDPGLFAGLAIASVIPTSNMSIAFTTMGKGNVPAAVKLMVSSLVVGSLLAPWYLLMMIGRYVPVDILTTVQTITVVVFLPIILGSTTYSLLNRRYTQEEIQRRFASYFPVITAWGLLFVVFVSISGSARQMMAQPDLLIVAILVQCAFYAIAYSLSFGIGKRFFEAKDATALVFSVALRHISISMGLAAVAFGTNAALMVTLAIPIQSQSAAWLVKLKNRLDRLP